MKDWHEKLLSVNPLIGDTYIAPNGRSLVDEIDAFGKFLLERVFVGENDLRLLAQLRSISKDPSLVAISISGFNDNPDRIFSYLVDGAMSNIMRVYDSQDATENHKHIFIDPRQLGRCRKSTFSSNFCDSKFFETHVHLGTLTFQKI